MGWWRFIPAANRINSHVLRHLSSLSSFSPNPNPSPNPSLSSSFLLPSKLRKKLKKKANSPRLKPIHPSKPLPLPSLDSILRIDSHFRFLTRARSFLSRLSSCSLPLDAAGKLHRELGFPRGRKPSRSAALHPLLFHLHRPQDPPDHRLHLGFTPLMESLLSEEQSIFDSTEPHRITVVRKLLMMSANHRIPLNKLYHCRHAFGFPDDFRDRVTSYPEFFHVAVDPPDGRHVLELVEWDPALAVSALERDFVAEEARVKRTFKFPVAHGKCLDLDEEDEKRMDFATTLPLVSPYSDGTKLEPWTVEAEKYRVGVVHEFLSLTLQKRAMIHHLVEFKEEFSFTRHMYQTLAKQPRAFYLAGTEMNWAVFLRNAYSEDGTLKEKDPLVVFEERLRRYACMTERDLEKEKELGEKIVGGAIGA